MDQDGAFTFTVEEAAAFAARLGLGRLGAEQIMALAVAMGRIAQAGAKVPRVSSKFDAPASLFSVPVP
ncbi:MAG TPA: hypothetical protein VMU87_11075 [Stellaceae bacterium]|nr:hypothetical protein [Stellaceae bacterium]